MGPYFCDFIFFLLDSGITFLITHCENICRDCLLIGKLLPSKLGVLAHTSGLCPVSPNAVSKDLKK